MKNKMDKMNLKKRGISTVIATVIMITLVLVIIGVVWVSINNLVSKEIQTAESCFGNFGKVTLDKRYTCLNSSSNELQFSISIGDITIDSVLVSISSQSGSKSLEISNTNMSNVKMYNGVYGQLVEIPEKNSGFTYVVDINAFGIGSPDSVSIAPIISENQCGVSDSLLDISKC